MRQSMMLVVFLGGRNIAKTVRAPMMVAVSLLQPVVWLLLFSQTFRALGSGPQLEHLGYHSYLSFLTLAMVVLSVLFTALQSGMATVADISTGMMDKLTASPIPRWAVLAARLYADAVLMVVQTVIVLGIAAAMGASDHAGRGGLALVIVFAVAFGVVWGVPVEPDRAANPQCGADDGRRVLSHPPGSVPVVGVLSSQPAAPLDTNGRRRQSGRLCNLRRSAADERRRGRYRRAADARGTRDCRGGAGAAHHPRLPDLRRLTATVRLT